MHPGVLGDASRQAPRTGCLAKGPAAAREQRVPGCRGLPHRHAPEPALRPQLSCPHRESREEGPERPPACSRYSPGALEGRTRASAARTRGEADHGKGLQRQSRLARKSLLNHTEREVDSQALKASGDQEEHPARLLHARCHCDPPSPEQTSGTVLAPAAALAPRRALPWP